MRRIAMLFPGQASQFVGMGKDYYDRFPTAREIYKEADSKLGFSITDLSFSGDMEELTLTKNAQPAILLHSIVVLSLLSERGIRPSIVAGHSLGEFSALVAAGCLRAMDALLIVRRRGELMYEAGERRPGTMAAVIGLDEKALSECVEEASKEGIVVIANYNSPDQLAVSGEVAAVERTMELARERGAKRVMKLKVSGAFHSPLMEETAEDLSKYMSRFRFGRLEATWISNVTGRPVSEGENIEELLRRQLFSPVRWVECMQNMIGMKPDAVFEVGPGKVLTGLLKRIDSGIEAVPLSSADSLEKVS